MILGLFTEMLAAGGIQRISLHTAAILFGLADRQERRVRLLSLNDPPGHHDLSVAGEQLRIVGFGGSKIKFTLAAMAAVPYIDFLYVGHVNLAPLGIVARLLRWRAWYCVATYGIEVWERLPTVRRLGLKCARIITSLSEFTAERLARAQGLTGRRVVVIPPALEPALSGQKARAWAPLLPPGRMLLTVARLTASDNYKGVDHVIQALPAVLTKVPDVYYVVVGDGDDLGRLERLALKAGIRDRVRFVGTRWGEDLAGYYGACDVFVMPSQSEGFGLVFLEAMSHGKPVVAAKSGGAPEIVEDGVTGMLVDYGDLDALVCAVTRLLTDSECRRRMGEAGRRRVGESYTFKHFRDRLETLLEDPAGLRAL